MFFFYLSMILIPPSPPFPPPPHTEYFYCCCSLLSSSLWFCLPDNDLFFPHRVLLLPWSGTDLEGGRAPGDGSGRGQRRGHLRPRRTVRGMEGIGTGARRGALRSRRVLGNKVRVYGRSMMGRNNWSSGNFIVFPNLLKNVKLKMILYLTYWTGNDLIIYKLLWIYRGYFEFYTCISISLIL